MLTRFDKLNLYLIFTYGLKETPSQEDLKNQIELTFFILLLWAFSRIGT
jgi:hypothetical protein